MHFWLKHSGARVLTNTRICKEATTNLTLDTAKNMVVSGQICMRENWDFDVKEIVFPTLPKGVTAEYNFAECFTYNDGVAYPDILSKKKTLSVKAHYTQVIWQSQ